MNRVLSETLLTSLWTQGALRCLDNRSKDEAALSVSSTVKRFVSLVNRKTEVQYEVFEEDFPSDIADIHALIL